MIFVKEGKTRFFSEKLSESSSGPWEIRSNTVLSKNEIHSITKSVLEQYSL